MIGRELKDAVAQAYPLRPLAGGGQKDLGRRGMGIFLQEMVFDLPGVIVAKAIGQFELVECMVIEPPFVIRTPWARQLHFIEDAELHFRALPAVSLAM